MRKTRSREVWNALEALRCAQRSCGMLCYTGAARPCLTRRLPVEAQPVPVAVAETGAVPAQEPFGPVSAHAQLKGRRALFEYVHPSFACPAYVCTL